MGCSPCQVVAGALERFLLKEYPQAIVEHRFNTTSEYGTMSEDRIVVDKVEEDFVLLATAPVLFRTPGSFSLWAALSRHEGVDGLVFTTLNLLPPLATWAWERADFGQHWRWVSAPLLSSTVVREHGFLFEDPERWIQWLETH